MTEADLLQTLQRLVGGETSNQGRRSTGRCGRCQTLPTSVQNAVLLVRAIRPRVAHLHVGRISPFDEISNEDIGDTIQEWKASSYADLKAQAEELRRLFPNVPMMETPR